MRARNRPPAAFAADSPLPTMPAGDAVRAVIVAAVRNQKLLPWNNRAELPEAGLRRHVAPYFVPNQEWPSMQRAERSGCSRNWVFCFSAARIPDTRWRKKQGFAAHLQPEP